MSTTTPEYTVTVDSEGATIIWQGQTFTVEPDDLTAGGWEHEPKCEEDHCDDGDCPPCTDDHLADFAGSEDAPLRVIERWHAEQNHFGALRHCDVEPCKALVISMGQRW